MMRYRAAKIEMLKKWASKNFESVASRSYLHPLPLCRFLSLFCQSPPLPLSPSDVLFEWPLRLCFLFMQEIKPEYKTNLQKLKNFVMVKFAKDTMVDPKESEVRYYLYCWSLFIWIIYAYSIKFTFFLVLVVRLLQTRASCGMSNASREWNLYAGILFLYCFRRLNFLSWPSLLCQRNVLLSFL